MPPGFLACLRKMGLCLTLIGVFCTACSPAAGSFVAKPVPSPASAFEKTLQTTDQQFLLQFSVTPNRYGINQFTVNVRQSSTGRPATAKLVQIFATMLDMEMGTSLLILPEKGNGRYSASGEFTMDGHWEIGIQIQDDHVHVARFQLYTPA